MWRVIWTQFSASVVCDLDAVFRQCVVRSGRNFPPVLRAIWTQFSASVACDLHAVFHQCGVPSGRSFPPVWRAIWTQFSKRPENIPVAERRVPVFYRNVDGELGSADVSHSAAPLSRLPCWWRQGRSLKYVYLPLCACLLCPRYQRGVQAVQSLGTWLSGRALGLDSNPKARGSITDLKITG